MGRIEALDEVIAFLASKQHDLEIEEFSRNAIARGNYNAAVAKACGLDVDRVSGAFAIVLRRDEEGRVDQQLGGWKGVGNYVQDVQDILNDLLPADQALFIRRKSADLTMVMIPQSFTDHNVAQYGE